MDEVRDFCIRVLGPGDDAEQAAREAASHAHQDRSRALGAAARACRARAGRTEKPALPAGSARSLVAAVAAEMAHANAQLPERHREALALREALGLSHEQIAQAIGIETAAVAPLLARARLQLRALRRGSQADGPGCDEREASLRLLARRQDSEPLSAEDASWIHQHLLECANCRRAHAAMLEASACYRAWQLEGGRAEHELAVP